MILIHFETNGASNDITEALKSVIAPRIARGFRDFKSYRLRCLPAGGHRLYLANQTNHPYLQRPTIRSPTGAESNWAILPRLCTTDAKSSRAISRWTGASRFVSSSTIGVVSFK